MAGKKSIPTRSLGTENVDVDIESLTSWVSMRKGRGGDLMTYRLETALAPQAGIDIPCAGGAFYAPRWKNGIQGVEGNALTGEPLALGNEVAQDAIAITAIRKNAWVSVPSCSGLGIADRYFHDRGEIIPALAHAYGDLARTMRDQGIPGHIYTGTSFPESELEELAGPRTIFFDEQADRKAFTRLLEHQTRVVMGARSVPHLGWLLDMYDIDELILIEPSPEMIRAAEEVLDRTKILAGGYCRNACDAYWESLSRSAVTG
jgi:hypothetical protein